MTTITRRTAASAARRGASVAFSALIVLSPFRARIELMARPDGPVYGDFTDVLLFWSDIAALVMIALWLLGLALHPRRLIAGPRFLAWPVAVLVIVAWLGVPFAADPVLSACTAIRLLALVMIGLYVVNEVKRLDMIVPPVALLIAIQSVVGIGQVVGQRSLGLASLGEYALSPSMAVSVITADDGTRLLRAYGLADHPNILGGGLALALVLIGVAAARAEGGSASWRAVVFALGTAAILVTFSRGSLLGLLAGLVVVAAMLWVSGDRGCVRRLGVVCVSGLMVAAPFAAPYRAALAARTDASGRSGTEVRSIDERVALSNATTDVVAAHPALGVGIGGLPPAIRAANPSFAYTYQPASVVLLDVTAETGLAGGAAYLVILVAPWVALWRIRRRWTADLAVASGALAVLTVVGLFDYYTWTYSAGRIWMALVLGLWVAAHRAAVET